MSVERTGERLGALIRQDLSNRTETRIDYGTVMALEMSLTDGVADYKSVTISNVGTLEDKEVTAWSSWFAQELQTTGQGLVGLQVEVHIRGGRYTIAYSVVSTAPYYPAEEDY